MIYVYRKGRSPLHVATKKLKPRCGSSDRVNHVTKVRMGREVCADCEAKSWR